METEQSHRVDTAENLRDAGCGEEFISRFLELERESDEKAQLAALAKYRRSLLEDVHICQKKLDVLDYLIRKKENGNAERGTEL